MAVLPRIGEGLLWRVFNRVWPEIETDISNTKVTITAFGRPRQDSKLATGRQIVPRADWLRFLKEIPKVRRFGRSILGSPSKGLLA
jgi:hypothetical protein